MSDDNVTTAIDSGSFEDQMAAMADATGGEGLDAPAETDVPAEDGSDEPEIETPETPADDQSDADEAEEPETSTLDEFLGKLDEKGRRELVEKLAGELKIDLPMAQKEKAAFRVKQKELFTEIQKREQQAAATLQQAREKVQGELEAQRTELQQIIAIKDAYDREDYEKMVELMGRFKDWNELSDHVITAKSDPTYKRMRALERERENERAAAEAEKQRQTKEAESRKEQEKRQEREQQISGQKQQISQQMAASSDPLLQSLHGWPVLVNAVYEVMLENLDPYSQETVTPEAALDTPILNGSTTIREQMRQLSESMGPAFAAKVAETTPAQAETEPAQTTTTAPKKGGKVRPVDDIFAIPKNETAAQKQKRLARESDYIRKQLAKAGGL